MIEQAIAVTNNKMAADKLEGKMEVIYIDGTLMDVLKISRDYIHKGHRLLTHPLSGSVKPNETPYKTILISKFNGKTIDVDSLSIIEYSIHTCEKLLKNKTTPRWPQKILDDFKLIDFDLIYNAIN